VYPSLVSHFSTGFYINLPVGAVVALFIVLIRIPDKIVKPHWRTVLRHPLTEFDLIGFALFAPSAVQFFLALQYGGNQYAWNSATVIGLFCGAGVNFIVFSTWNYRQGDLAMIPVSMLSKRVVWSSCSSVLFFAGTIFVTSYYLPIYFQIIKNESPLMSGVDVLANILPQMVMTGIAGKLGE
jgi:Fungal trichothecene efflux pump (TRI12)